jgi:hypothetical protein
MLPLRFGKQTTKVNQPNPESPPIPVPYSLLLLRDYTVYNRPGYALAKSDR